MIDVYTTSHIQRVARAYRATPHTPNHASYQSFVNETVGQYNALLADGWKFTRVSDVTPSVNTYSDSNAMFRDIARKCLRVDTLGQNFAANHPLARTLADGWTVNEAFRAVHDVLGHGTTLTPFESFSGELEAYHNHSRLYSLASIPALYAETVGQLCHFYAGYGFVETQESKVLSPM